MSKGFRLNRLFRSTIIFIWFFMLCDLSFAINQNPLITDPSFSIRCEKLIAERKRQIQLKQKTDLLIERSEKLLKSAETKRELAINRLNFIYTRLNQEQRLLQHKISRQEEDIIRKGCPGITISPI